MPTQRGAPEPLRSSTRSRTSSERDGVGLAEEDLACRGLRFRYSWSSWLQRRSRRRRPAAIKIAKIYYDSPGSDTGSNTSLNGEWVTIKNTGNSGRSLGDWRIRDRAGHVYRFASGFRLGGGETVKLHTGRGSNSAHHRYWDAEAYVWNNDSDRAVLKKANGDVVDRCSYNNSSPDARVC
jgi:Lamin Tail Domain